MRKHFHIRKFQLLTLLLLILCLAIGCGETSQPPVAQEIEESETEDGRITWQTDNVTSTKSTTTMSDNTFYIEHTNEDGSVLYYNLGSPSLSDPNAYYLSGTEDIPTLFVGQGDRLLFHSYANLLQNIYFTRLQDLGYTIGIYDIATLENGRCYLPTGKDHVLPLCTDATFLDNEEAKNILIDEMGKTLPSGYEASAPTPNKKTYSYWNKNLYYYDGYKLMDVISTEDYKVDNTEYPTAKNVHYPKLNSDTVQRGVLYGLEKDALYHVEFYTGTYYEKADMKANLHILSQKEYFHTNQYEVLQSTLFEIELPEMKNGVYLVGLNAGNGKAFRLINEDSYEKTDTFDEFVLPKGLYGIKSDTPAYNNLNVFGDIEDCTYVTETSEFETGTLHFEYSAKNNTYFEDNGISWFYQKDGVQVGRILERHKDLLLPKDNLIEYAIYTLTEVNSGKYIKRCFLPLETKEPIIEEIVFEEPVDDLLEDMMGQVKDNPLFEDMFSEEEPELVTIEVFEESFTDCDLAFIHEEGLLLNPKKGMTGIVVLNAVREGEPNVSILPANNINE